MMGKKMNKQINHLKAIVEVIAMVAIILCTCSCAVRGTDEAAATPEASSTEPVVDNIAQVSEIPYNSMPTTESACIGQLNLDLDKQAEKAKLIVIATALKTAYIPRNSIIQTDGQTYPLEHSVTTYRIEEIIRFDETRKLKAGDEIEVFEEYFLVDSDFYGRFIATRFGGIPTSSGKTYLLLLHNCFVPAESYANIYMTHTDFDGRFLLSENVKNKTFSSDKLTPEDLGIGPNALEKGTAVEIAKQARDKYILGD